MFIQRLRILFLLATLSVLSAACVTFPSKKDIRQAENLYQLGVEQTNRGEYRAALAILFRAEKLNPHDYWIQEAIGGTMMHMGRPEMALKHFLRSLELNAASPRGWNNLGTAYSALERWPKAIEAYEKALESILYQTPCFAEMNLGWAYHKVGQAGKARLYLQRATHGCPKICQGHRLAGLIALDHKRFEDAALSFGQLTTLCKDFLPGHLLYARSLLPLKKYTEAVASLQTCSQQAQTSQPELSRTCQKTLEEAKLQMARLSSSH